MHKYYSQEYICMFSLYFSALPQRPPGRPERGGRRRRREPDGRDARLDPRRAGDGHQALAARLRDSQAQGIPQSLRPGSIAGKTHTSRPNI